MSEGKTLPAWQRFFKDREGHWEILQLPNFLLSAWILLLIMNLFIHSQPVDTLKSAILFAWAYIELTEGISYFRKTLGAVVLAVVILGFFM